MAKSRSHSSHFSGGYDTLAQEYLDLMQRQMSGAITHPDFIRAMLELTQAMGTQAHARADRYASPASGTHNDAISKLERRVAKLERQLADVHAQLAAAELRRHDGKSGTRSKVRPKPAAKRPPAKKAAKRKPKRR